MRILRAGVCDPGLTVHIVPTTGAIRSLPTLCTLGGAFDSQAVQLSVVRTLAPVQLDAEIWHLLGRRPQSLCDYILVYTRKEGMVKADAEPRHV